MTHGQWRRGKFVRLSGKAERAGVNLHKVPPCGLA
jgi:hypothetical protein